MDARQALRQSPTAAPSGEAGPGALDDRRFIGIRSQWQDSSHGPGLPRREAVGFHGAGVQQRRAGLPRRTTRGRWRIRSLATLGLGLALWGCSGSGGSDDSGMRDLTLKQVAEGSLKTAGQVDWYRLRAVEANNVLKVRCNSNTYRADEELSVAVYEVDASGARTRLMGDHAPKDGQLPADLEMNLYVDHPKELLIAIRDLDDDEASGKPYYLSADFAGAEEEDQHFSTAVELGLDGAAREGTIGYMGDVDCYRFAAPSDGVYAVDVHFTPFQGGTSVEPRLDLYDGEGRKLDSLAASRQTQSRLLVFLRAGTHYAVVQDEGRNDFDDSSLYAVSVAPAAADEAMANDQQASATALTLRPADAACTAAGALGYRGDRDWYRLPVGSASASGLKVLDVSFETPAEGPACRYRLELTDGAGRTLLAHDYASGSAPYHTQLLAGQGDHFLAVREAEGHLVSNASPYAATVQVLDASDPAEAPPGNDTITTAQALTPSPTQWTEGYIAYRGDEDWYSVQASTDAPRVLEVFVETDAPSRADLAVSVLRDEVIRRLVDTNGEDGPTKLRTSVFVPAASPPGQVTYFFRVADAQGDEGDARVPYRIRCNLADMPSALPSDPATAGAVYFDEAAEREAPSAVTVRLEQTSLVKREYAADTEALRFRGATLPPGVTVTTDAGLTTVTFPWLSGYVDEQGDQDWFELDLRSLAREGFPPDQRWYYEIRVDFHAGGSGSTAEYVWKLHRDDNQNRILVDRPGDSDGYFASAGDNDLAVAPFDVTVPQAGTTQKFWVGDPWAGKFYLSVGDFDFVDAAEPDADWGYDAPYAFRVTLVYHAGVSRPQ